MPINLTQQQSAELATQIKDQRAQGMNPDDIKVAAEKYVAENAPSTDEIEQSGSVQTYGNQRDTGSPELDAHNRATHINDYDKEQVEIDQKTIKREEYESYAKQPLRNVEILLGNDFGNYLTFRNKGVVNVTEADISNGIYDLKVKRSDEYIASLPEDYSASLNSIGANIKAGLQTYGGGYGAAATTLAADAVDFNAREKEGIGAKKGSRQSIIPLVKKQAAANEVELAKMDKVLAVEQEAFTTSQEALLAKRREIIDVKESGGLVGPERQREYKALGERLLKDYGNLGQVFNTYKDTLEKTGNADLALDAFKRSHSWAKRGYHSLEQFGDVIGLFVTEVAPYILGAAAASNPATAGLAALHYANDPEGAVKTGDKILEGINHWNARFKKDYADGIAFRNEYIERPGHLDDIDNVEDFFEWAAEGIVDNLPSAALVGASALSGGTLTPFILPMFFAMGAGGRLGDFHVTDLTSERELESINAQLGDGNLSQKQADELIRARTNILANRDATLLERYGTALAYGTAEVVFERLGTFKILDDIAAVGKVAKANKSALKLARLGTAKGARKTLPKSLLDKTQDFYVNSGWAGRTGLNFSREAITEGATQIAQNMADVYILGEDKPLTENVVEAALHGGIFGIALGGIGGGYRSVLNAYGTVRENKYINASLAKIDALTKEYMFNEELTDESRNTLAQDIQTEYRKAGGIQDILQDRIFSLSTEETNDLFEVDRATREARRERAAIVNSSMSQALKTEKIEQINESIIKLGLKRDSIVHKELDFNELEALDNLTIAPKGNTSFSGIKTKLEGGIQSLESTRQRYEHLQKESKYDDAVIADSIENVDELLREKKEQLQKVNRIIEKQKEEGTFKAEEPEAAKVERISEATVEEKEKIEEQVSNPVDNSDVIGNAIGNTVLTNADGKSINFSEKNDSEDIEEFVEGKDGKSLLQEALTFAAEQKAIEAESEERTRNTQYRKVLAKIDALDADISGSKDKLKEYNAHLAERNQEILDDLNDKDFGFDLSKVNTKYNLHSLESKVIDGYTLSSPEDVTLAAEQSLTTYLDGLSRYGHASDLLDQRKAWDKKKGQGEFDRLVNKSVARALQDALDGETTLIRFISSVAKNIPFDIDITLSEGAKALRLIQLAKYVTVPYITSRFYDVGSSKQLKDIKKKINKKEYLKIIDSHIAELNAKTFKDTNPTRLIKITDKNKVMDLVIGTNVPGKKDRSWTEFQKTPPKGHVTEETIKVVDGVEIRHVKAYQEGTRKPSISKVWSIDTPTTAEAPKLYQSLENLGNTPLEIDSASLSLILRNFKNEILVQDGKDLTIRIDDTQDKLDAIYAEYPAVQEYLKKKWKKVKGTTKAEAKADDSVIKETERLFSLVRKLKRARDTREDLNFDAVSIAIKEDAEEGPIYEIHFTDTRMGRVYSATVGLNHQGTSLEKSLFSFHNKVKLGNAGLGWLLIQAGGTYGHQADSIAALLEWGHLNIETLVKWSVNPDAYLDSLKEKDAIIPDDVPLFMQTLEGIREALASDGKIQDFESGKPVHIDSTNSGAQWFTGLIKDEHAAELVNLSQNIKRRDLYLKIAEGVFREMSEKERQEYFEPVAEEAVDLVFGGIILEATEGEQDEADKADNQLAIFDNELFALKEAEASDDIIKEFKKDVNLWKKANRKAIDLSARILFGQIVNKGKQRKISKNPVMTKFYSSVPSEMGKKIQDALEGEEGFEGLRLEHSNWLAKQLYEIAGEELPKVEMLRVMISESTKDIAGQVSVKSGAEANGLNNMKVAIKTALKNKSPKKGDFGVYGNMVNYVLLRQEYKADPEGTLEEFSEQADEIFKLLKNKEDKTRLKDLTFFMNRVTNIETGKQDRTPGLERLSKEVYYDSETDSFDFRGNNAKAFLGPVLVPQEIIKSARQLAKLNQALKLEDYVAIVEGFSKKNVLTPEQTKALSQAKGKIKVAKRKTKQGKDNLFRVNVPNARNRSIWEKVEGVNAQGKDFRFKTPVSGGISGKRYRNTKEESVRYPYPLERDDAGNIAVGGSGANPYYAGEIKRRQDIGSRDADNITTKAITGLTDIRVNKAGNSSAPNLAQTFDSSPIHFLSLIENRGYDITTNHDSVGIPAGAVESAMEDVYKGYKASLEDQASTLDGSLVPMLQFVMEQAHGRESALDLIESIDGYGSWNVDDFQGNREMFSIAGKAITDDADKSVLIKDNVKYPNAEGRDIREEYQDDLRNIKESNPDQYWSVDDVDPNAGGQVIEVEGGKGFVKTDGDIVGVFGLEGDAKKSGAGGRILEAAVKAGGIKLDNFDNYLTKIYKKAGFRTVATTPFSVEYAPDGWNNKKHGQPDVAAMIYDPENQLDIEEKSFEEYDDMIAYRDKFVATAEDLYPVEEIEEPTPEVSEPAVEEPAQKLTKKEQVAAEITDIDGVSHVTEGDSENTYFAKTVITTPEGTLANAVIGFDNKGSATNVISVEDNTNVKNPDFYKQQVDESIVVNDRAIADFEEVKDRRQGLINKELGKKLKKKIKSLKRLFNLKGEVYKTSGRRKFSKVDNQARQEIYDLKKKYINELGELSEEQIDKLLVDIINIVEDGRQRQRYGKLDRAEIKTEVNKGFRKTILSVKPDLEGVNLNNDEVLRSLAKKNSSISQRYSEGGVAGIISDTLAPNANNDFFGLLGRNIPYTGQARVDATEYYESGIFYELKRQPIYEANLKVSFINSRSDAFTNAGITLEESLKESPITVEGQKISISQAVRTFNHALNPQLHPQMEGAGYTLEKLAEIVAYVKSDPRLDALAKGDRESYAPFKSIVNSTFEKWGEKTMTGFLIDANPDVAYGEGTQRLLDIAYDGEIPREAPYTPFSAKNTGGEIDIIETYSDGVVNPSIVAKQFIDRTRGGVYTTYGKNMETDAAEYISGAIHSIASYDLYNVLTDMFNNKTYTMLEAAHGKTYVKAIKNVIERIVVGKNIPLTEPESAKAVRAWINGSIGSVMFLNTRSSILQWLSMANFAVENPDIYAAGSSIAVNNPEKRARALELLSKEPWMIQRFQGKFTPEADELHSEGWNLKDTNLEFAQPVVSGTKKLLEKGYILTKLGDIGAIKYGGLPWLLGKIDSLEKITNPKTGQPYTTPEAEERAMFEFISLADENQQTSNPIRLGLEQTSNFGRLVGAFSNTQQAYNRVIAKELKVLASDETWDVKKKAWRKIVSYGVVQNLMFNAFQQLALGLLWGDDDDDKGKILFGNALLDTFLRGIGIWGNVIATMKNVAIATYTAAPHRRGEVAIFSALNFAPAIGHKARSVKNLFGPVYPGSDGYADAPDWVARLALAGDLANLPTKRALFIMDSLNDLLAQDINTLGKIARVSGWSRYQVEER